MFSIIKAALFGADIPERVDEKTFLEMKQHAIAALPADLLPSVNMSGELRRMWQAAVLQVLTFNAQCEYIENRLPVSVPYVVLKGSSAARYYPKPEYRSRGDIDIMTRPADHPAACDELLHGGYSEVIKIDELDPRHRSFLKDGVTVEVHSGFAIASELARAEYLDDLIIQNITPDHVLPDPVNGLVLLAHMNHHLEEGLGLRHVTDWMMFVDKCLPDEKWPAFRIMVRKTGLEKLAVTAARMCELYLGLPERIWCSGADEMLCRRLMEYILFCGNFGRKKSYELTSGMNVFSNIHSPASLFRQLQRRGLINWKAAQKYPALRPFAWIYQSFRYICKGFFRKKALSSLLAEHHSARQREALLEALGVNQGSKETTFSMSEVRAKEQSDGKSE